jgi:hypothetical protein
VLGGVFTKKLELISERATTNPPRRPPPLTLRRQPRRNIFFTIFFFARAPEIFSIKEKKMFLLGSALQVFGRCGGASTLGRLGIPPPDPLLPSRPRFGAEIFLVAIENLVQKIQSKYSIDYSKYPRNNQFNV